MSLPHGAPATGASGSRNKAVRSSGPHGSVCPGRLMHAQKQGYPRIMRDFRVRFGLPNSARPEPQTVAARCSAPRGGGGVPPYHGVGAGVYVLRPGCFGGVGRRRCDRAWPPWAEVRRRWWWPHRARRFAGRWSSGASMWSTSVAGASQRAPVSPRMAVQRWPSRSRMARRMAGQLRGSGVVRPLLGPHGIALPPGDGVPVFGHEEGRRSFCQLWRPN